MADNSLAERTWFVFTTGQKKYALLSSEVKEILRNVPVFSLPFVPEYIDGILNRYGEPYAVIDPSPLLGDAKQNSALFIVLKSESHICLRITDVLEFQTIADSKLKYFSNSEGQSYYECSFEFDGTEVLVLNPLAFIEKVEKDIEAS